MKRDPFSGEPMGVFSCLGSIDLTTKERSYAANAYYTPVADRQNLQLLTDSMVNRVLLDSCGQGDTLQAIGVELERNGSVVTLGARKEVILAAGALQSPKILHLSGTGPEHLLQSHGIDVRISNSYVGKNLQDHIVCSIGFEANDSIPTMDGLMRQDPKAIAAAMDEYAKTRTGPMVSTGVAWYAYLPVNEFILYPKMGRDFLRNYLTVMAQLNRHQSCPYRVTTIS